MNPHSNRRNVLKGLTLSSGSMLLPPLLGRIRAQSEGAPPPKRFVFVLQNNGFQPWAAMPEGMEWGGKKGGPEKLIDLDLSRRQLSEDLSPLEAHKQRVTILQRLQGKHCKPFHSGGYAALAGSARSSRPLAPTIDGALAREFPGVFPIVGLGLAPRDDNNTGAAYICSAWDADQPIATQCNPDLAYRRLFGSVVAGNGRTEFDGRTSLLDFMKDDVKRVRARLAGDELEKFDKYLEAFETMGARQRRLAKIADQLRPHLPEHNEKYTSSNGKHRLEMQFELAAAALISGLTNIVTICSGLCSPNGSLRGFGVDISVHQLGHRESQGERGYKELYTHVRKQHIELVAGLVANLEAVEEGGGTMMDNTLITYTSDSAETHHSSGNEWPFVLVGDLDGKLRAGRYLEYPAFGDPGNRSINALYCTILHAAGKPRDHFNLVGATKEVDKPGPLEDLLA